MVLKVFVAGPYIEKTWSLDERLQAPISAQLRMHIIDAIEGLNHDVLLGEHRGVAEMADKNLKSKASVMLSEIALATEGCDAIVIIPDSPGSFCELGSWAMLDSLCRKMLILGHSAYESAVSYVGTGVFKAAEDEGASVQWIDYSDHTAASTLVTAFIERIHDTALARMVKAGRG